MHQVDTAHLNKVKTKFEEVNNEDLEKLRKTFTELATIYGYLQCPSSAGYNWSEFLLVKAYCDRHLSESYYNDDADSRIRSRFKKMKDAIEKMDTERF